MSIMEFGKKVEILASVRRSKSTLMTDVIENISTIVSNIEKGQLPFISDADLVNVYGYKPERAKYGPRATLEHKNVIATRNLVFSVNRARDDGVLGWSFTVRKATVTERDEAQAFLDKWKRLTAEKKARLGQ